MTSFSAIFALVGVTMLTSAVSCAPVDAPTETLKTDWTVAQDGSGDFKTLQEAIVALPDQSPKRLVVHIKPGTYQGQIIVPKEKNNVTFQGDDVTKTILTFALNTNEPQTPDINPRFKGTGVVVLGDNFRADNITFQNTSGDHGQALALRVDGDRAILTHCRLLGWQDTLMVNSGRQYFNNCYIEGRVDFIYGSGTTVFDQCEIKSKNGGHITAASTPEEKPYGFVFLDCKLTSDPNPWTDPTTGKWPEGRKWGAQADLGRPWRPYGNVAYINCQMGDHIIPAGWNNWGKPENEKTARYAEFASRGYDIKQTDGEVVRGAPVDVSKRVPWSKQLSAEDAAKYTLSGVLSGADNWNPRTEIGALAATAMPAVVRGAIQTAETAPELTAVVLSHPLVALAGDSTVTDNAGWGEGFKNLLKPGLTLVNLARGGRSSRSFRDEGLWQKTLDLKPQYVLIQFGHNDQPGHGPERESDPTLYRQNMARYVDEARAAGVTPILVTPLSRRQWNQGGTIQSTLEPYAQAVRSVAVEKNVPLIDLHARSIALYEKLGRDKMNTFSPTKEGGQFDGTHLNAAGSAAIGPLVVDELRKAVPALANDFKG